jgi:hypothetical protein
MRPPPQQLRQGREMRTNRGKAAASYRNAAGSPRARGSASPARSSWTSSPLRRRPFLRFCCNRASNCGLGRTEARGWFAKICNAWEQFNTRLFYGSFCKQSSADPAEFGWIFSNSIKLDQIVPGLQVMGVVLSTLQVLGLNYFNSARYGTKNVYITS